MISAARAPRTAGGEQVAVDREAEAEVVAHGGREAVVAAVDRQRLVGAPELLGTGRGSERGNQREQRHEGEGA